MEKIFRQESKKKRLGKNQAVMTEEGRGSIEAISDNLRERKDADHLARATSRDFPEEPQVVGIDVVLFAPREEGDRVDQSNVAFGRPPFAARQTR
ncbi:hypothetical protein [Caballeronia arationis]|uniref:hypothetical protein n=1 Tax=Caballeronia arationis TaxID=1777142 RepID=UPI001198264C|nr:hypothetical protein [Caballeronia arationis]